MSGICVLNPVILVQSRLLAHKYDRRSILRRRVLCSSYDTLGSVSILSFVGIVTPLVQFYNLFFHSASNFQFTAYKFFSYSQDFRFMN